MGGCLSKSSSDRSQQYAAGTQQRGLNSGGYQAADGAISIDYYSGGLQDWTSQLDGRYFGRL
jgi:hypothetical protein